MQPRGQRLINTPGIELWPGGLLRARANRDARILARARWVLRRKRDGRYLAAELPEGLVSLVPALAGEPGIDDALEALAHHGPRPRSGPSGTLPLAGLEARLESLGLDVDGYAERTGLGLVPEPVQLRLAGFDRFRRPLWLEDGAARAWDRLQRSARRDGVVLEAISGYRSHDYQLGIFERKRERGQGIDEILAVNAAPGFSEHHSGQALDIGTPGEPPAEETFEGTDAYRWLCANAPTEGFVLSYPRDNPHGIAYEPWHWRFSPGSA